MATFGISFTLKIYKMKQLFLALLVGCSNFLLAQTATKISVDVFEAKLKQTPTAQVLDVRTPAEFANGYLQNALNIDFRNSEFKERIAKLDKSKPVFVYCLSGGRSASAAQLLQEQGFTEVYDLQGGFAKWLAADKPFLKKEGTTPAPKALSVAEFEQMTASDTPVLVDFFAPWCAPCQKMLPTIEGFKTSYKGKMSVQTINFDDNKNLAKALGIDEIPTLLIYAKGKLLWRGIGFMPAEMLQKTIDEALTKLK
jgi:thioredoxin 1